MIDRTSVEILPADWRTRAKTLRRYGGETPAVALEACAAELETAPAPERRHDSDADKGSRGESCYSAAHLGRLVREGKVPNAGRPGTPRIARGDLPHEAGALAESRLAAKPSLREVSTGQIVQCIIEEGIG